MPRRYGDGVSMVEFCCTDNTALLSGRQKTAEVMIRLPERSLFPTIPVSFLLKPRCAPAQGQEHNVT